MTKQLLLLALLAPQCLWAWGTVGHRTVGAVAERFLTAKTKSIIIGQHLGGESLAQVSNWADTIRKDPSRWGHTFAYHFESIQDRSTYLKSLEAKTPAQQRRGGLVEAILESKAKFLAANSTPTERSEALKFLVHFVGDAHQPLHSGRPEDSGGNGIIRKWNNRTTNLHTIWDSYLIQESYEQDLPEKEHLDEELYADHLLEKFAHTQLPGDAYDINQWLKESMRVRTKVYQHSEEPASEYTGRFIDTVDQRLYFAGVRLAAILTRLAKSYASTTVEMDFRAAIEAIVGPLNQIISLTPREAKTEEKAQDQKIEAELRSMIFEDSSI